MRTSLRQQVQFLKTVVTRFDPVSREAKYQSLECLSVLPLHAGADLVTYSELLLFILSYPGDEVSYALAEKEWLRLTRFLKKTETEKKKKLENTGLPFTQTITRFSHDGVRWLLAQTHCTTILHAFAEPTLSLNDVLRLTLPSLEKSETTAGLLPEELMDALLVPRTNQLAFLVQQLARLDHVPYIKDLLFDKLDVFVRVIPKDASFSKAYNRLPVVRPFIHHEIVKRFDVRSVLDTPLPDLTNMTLTDRNNTIRVIKNAMAITARETDPTTFMDEASLRLYQVDRGISIAIYGMVPSRQLPLESYVGFTAFKNGFPASYGGAWVFGARSNFGINIFETYRSGESAYMMAQLLRVYRHVFQVHYFEIEPYQFGLDNPEGIESGAFWFYYRFGFRPLDPGLWQLAKKETEKIKAKPGYRSGHKTLTAFTESSMGLQLGRKIPPRVYDITIKVTRMIRREYQGDRSAAEEACIKIFLHKTGMATPGSPEEGQVLKEVALWAEAMKITSPAKLALMVDMIRLKPKDAYAYQQCILHFFSLPSS